MSWEKKSLEQYLIDVKTIREAIKEHKPYQAICKCNELIKKMDVILDNLDNLGEEICNECGRSVAEGSGLFVNRIISLDDFETRKEMGKPFPNGGYICRECWERDGE